MLRAVSFIMFLSYFQMRGTHYSNDVLIQGAMYPGVGPINWFYWCKKLDVC